MKKHLFKTLLLILMVSKLIAQESYKPKIIPPSPTIASINKFIDVPVSHFTGVPNISIPLCEIKGSKLSVPISISYHASGIKVDEIPGWIGQNWVLNVGGSISRIMMGKPDEIPGGYFTVGDEIPDPTNNTSLLYGWQPSNTWLSNVANGLIDAEPDIFFYNFNGQSGKFVFSVDASGNRKINTIPYTKLDIKEIFDASGEIVKWDIRDESGTHYIFGKSEDGLRTAVEKTNYHEGIIYNSCWQLMDIKSASDEDNVKFFYKSSNEDYDLRISVTLFNYLRFDGIGGQSCQGDHYSYSNNQITVTTYKIDKIETSNQTVNFISTADRLDFNGLKLNKIEIKDQNGILRHSFSFIYDYFSVGSRLLDKRLRLDQLIEQGDNGSSIPAYIFSYNSTVPPARDSYAQDWWGFYNGQISNATLIPEITGTYPMAGAKREPDITGTGTYLKAGVLEKITFPTGGYSMFEYEPNDYGFIKDNPVLTEALISLPPVNVLANNQSTPDYIYDTKTLNIDHTQNVTISYTLQDNSNEQEGLDASIEVKDPDGNVVYKIEFSGSGSKTIMLSGPCTYSLVAKAGIKQYAYATLNYTKYDPNASTVKINRTGGIRIKKITEYSGTESKVREYSYRLKSDLNYSSGCLVSNKPVFSYNFFVPVITTSPITGLPLFNGYCVYLARTSSPQSANAIASGSHIEYAEITEKFGLSGANGSIYYSYISPRDYSDLETLVFPFPQIISKEWQRGMLKEKIIYNNVGDTIQKQQNFYSIYNSTGNVNRKSIPGIKAAYLKKSDNNPQMDEIRFEPYEIISGWYNLNKTIMTIYSTSGKLVNETYYYYNTNHLQLSREIRNNSIGKYDQTDYLYVPDNPSLSNTLAATISNMIGKNMINVLLKKVKFCNGQMSGNQVINSSFSDGLINNYKIENSLVVPSSIETSKSDGSYEQILLFDSYTAKGNISQLHKVNDINEVYLWDSKGIYPMAKVMNVNFSQISSLNGLDCSYSSKTLYSSLKNLVPGALINTFSYKPLIGVKEQTDASGITICYEYDNFGRLSLEKDDDNKLLKKYDYHYANQ